MFISLRINKLKEKPPSVNVATVYLLISDQLNLYIKTTSIKHILTLKYILSSILSSALSNKTK